jgi:hypothetical protein
MDRFLRIATALLIWPGAALGNASQPSSGAQLPDAAPLPEMRVVRGKGVSVEIPVVWKVDSSTGRFVVPEADRQRISGALVSESASNSIAEFLNDIEPSITAAQMKRISVHTRPVEDGEQTDIEYGRGASTPTLTLTGVITTSGPRTVLAFCGSTPERQPSGEVVCAPILASLRLAPTDATRSTDGPRTSGEGWSVALPKGWREDEPQELTHTSVRLFVSPQVGIAPVFFQIGTDLRLNPGEAGVRAFLAAFFGSSSDLRIKPGRVGDADALEFRAQKAQPVAPAFALFRLVVAHGWRVGALCLGSNTTDRALCAAVVQSVRIER